MTIAFLGQSDRGDAETEKTGVVAGQSGFDRRIIQEVVVQQFFQFGVVLTGRTAADRQHAFNAGIAQTFSQHALPDHSGRTKHNDFHAQPFMPFVQSLAGISSPR